MWISDGDLHQITTGMWKQLPTLDKLALDAIIFDNENEPEPGHTFMQATYLLNTFHRLGVKSVSVVVNNMPDILDSDLIFTQPQGNPHNLLAALPEPSYRTPMRDLANSWHELETLIDEAMKRDLQERRR
jgi:hypothetical protein